MVADLNAQALSITREIRRLECNTRVLLAEWKHLTNPERLQGLTARHLNLMPTEIYQLTSIDSLQSIISKNKSKLHRGYDQLQQILVKIDPPTTKTLKKK